MLGKKAVAAGSLLRECVVAGGRLVGSGSLVITTFSFQYFF